MTPRQRDLLYFIQTHLRKHQVAPTYSEMAAALGLSSRGSLVRMVGELAEQGHLTVAPRKSRGIALTNPLAKIPTNVLRAELERRGWEVQ